MTLLSSIHLEHLKGRELTMQVAQARRATVQVSLPHFMLETLQQFIVLSYVKCLDLGLKGK